MDRDILVDRLAEAIGAENVLAGDGALRYASDATGVRAGGGAAGVVAFPADACETAKIVAIARASGLPIVARGGGTGLRGGAVPLRAGVVISTERMKGACEIHKEDLYVIARAGLTIRELRREVEAAGLYFPIDPASESDATVGGCVGDGAVGMHGVKYGTMRNYVLGLEVVTPEAKVVSLGAKTVKSVAGYDLTRFMVGAEGAFGVVTSATLKVLPVGERRVLVFAFGDDAAAGSAVAKIMERGFDPAALEIADATTGAAVREFLGRSPEGALLLVEFHGAGSLCDKRASKVKEMLEKTHRARVWGEAGYPDAESLWSVRKAALAALASRSPTVLLVDLAIPCARIPELLDEVPAVAARHKTAIAVFGHAGEGILHAAFLTDRDEREAWLRTRAAMSGVTATCAGLGGSVSSARGIGLQSLPGPWPAISETGLEVLGRIKGALDPDGIMNPGKIGREGWRG